jgi:hypothetical protein
MRTGINKGLQPVHYADHASRFEIIELSDAGLYGKGRLKNHMIDLWNATGIPGYPHKTPCRT